MSGWRPIDIRKCLILIILKNTKRLGDLLGNWLKCGCRVDRVDMVDTVPFLMFDMAQYTVLNMAEYMALDMIITLKLATTLDVDVDVDVAMVFLEVTAVTTDFEHDDLQQVRRWIGQDDEGWRGHRQR